MSVSSVSEKGVEKGAVGVAGGGGRLEVRSLDAAAEDDGRLVAWTLLTLGAAG